MFKLAQIMKNRSTSLLLAKFSGLKNVRPACVPPLDLSSITQCSEERLTPVAIDVQIHRRRYEKLVRPCGVPRLNLGTMNIEEKKVAKYTKYQQYCKELSTHESLLITNMVKPCILHTRGR